MEFRISDTFTDSLIKLTNQEQKAVKMTSFDLQLDPSSSGLRFHKLDRAKDPNFWSVSVNKDIRIIVHRTQSSLMLCYVNHHDDAYKWANKRKIERHPRTGAAQLVEVRETVEEIIIHKPVEAPAPVQAPLFAGISDDELLNYGIPLEWIESVQHATEDTLFDVAEHLPQEAAEALLELATGGKPQPPVSAPDETDPFSHPDAQRRFRVMGNTEELQRALDYPWEKWTVFLHPAQRHLVEKDYSGPARISGSAGTGKTIVALHRAVFLARRYPTARILLTTFSKALANALQIKLNRLVGNEPEVHQRIQVRSIRDIAHDLYTDILGEPAITDSEHIQEILAEAAAQSGKSSFTETFLWGEWNDVVDAWQLDTWNDYREVQRLGRKTRLGSKQREQLWAIFQRVKESLRQQNLITWAALFHRVTQHLTQTSTFPFDFAIIDEAQDLGITEIRFLAALGTHFPDSLFFTGDLGQRIFQQPYSWKSQGVDIRGRSQNLTINYRTSHQIRQQADRLLPTSITDVDGNTENRRNTISVFNGPPPEIALHDNVEDEIQSVSEWIANRMTAGIQPEEIGVFVRSQEQMERAIATIHQSDAQPVRLDESTASAEGCIGVSTMHLAKGLEFRAVVVMACDDEVLPLQERIENISDEADLEEVYNTERHLLYVACTRARDHLLISGIDPASEFLDDLNE